MLFLCCSPRLILDCYNVFFFHGDSKGTLDYDRANKHDDDRTKKSTLDYYCVRRQGEYTRIGNLTTVVCCGKSSPLFLLCFMFDDGSKEYSRRLYDRVIVVAVSTKRTGRIALSTIVIVLDNRETTYGSEA